VKCEQRHLSPVVKFPPMTNLLAARLLMAISLAFHIIFAVVGIALPLMMVIAEGIWLKRKDPVYLELAKRWARGMVVFFAVGAVSGTVLSIQLGLLWPQFMAFAGPLIGLPFSMEGFAFFLEAIFLGLYIYGWDKISPRFHWFAGMMVAFSAVASAIFVVTVNAWMNSPAGFMAENGRLIKVNLVAAVFNPAALEQVIHMVIAAYQSVGFAVAGIHGALLLKNPRNLFHRAAFGIALAVGSIASVLEPASGDISAKHLARYQPVKFAAMEGQWETEKGAPLRIGGWPSAKEEKTFFAIEISQGLSVLARLDPDAVVMGLKDVPPENRPPVAVVHLAFQIMVGAGMIMLLVGLIGIWRFVRKRELNIERWYLWLVVGASPLGLLALESGWVVTEVGRQPWIIYNFMRTAEAVTPMPRLMVPLILFSAVYVLLGVMVLMALRHQIRRSPEFPPGPGQSPNREASRA